MVIESESTPRFQNGNWFQLRGILVLGLMLLSLTSLTLLLEFFQIDLRVAKWAFSDSQGWPLGYDQPWLWIVEYGTIPGFITILLALLGWYLAQRNQRWYIWRRYMLVYGLVSIIGAGIVINALLKEHSGRPRPREVVQFNGPWKYRPALEFGIPGKGRSFPCGHCSMGFSFSVGIVFWQRSRMLAMIFLLGGLIYGGLISIGRILQGGHFVSDAIWSLGVLWITLTLLYYFIFQPPRSEKQLFTPLKASQQRWLLLGVILFAGFLIGLYVTRRPFYQDYRQKFRISNNVKSLIINTNLAKERFHLKSTQPTPSSERTDETAELFLEGRGFALPDAEFRVDFSTDEKDGIQTVDVKIKNEGYFAELETYVRLGLPKRLLDAVRITRHEEKIK